jgi:hypothetical protein
MPRHLRKVAVSLASATRAKRTSATTEMMSVLHWTRTRTSTPLGTNPRNRIQCGLLVYLVSVFLTIWLQQTNVIVVCNTPRYVHLTIGLHSPAPKQKFVSTFRHSTKIKIAPLGVNTSLDASPNHCTQQPNTNGDNPPQL